MQDLTLGIVAKLLLSSLLGALVGLEREWRKKPAGLRTMMLISFGATMFTLLSAEIAHRTGGDGARIASQLIPGIGFIGAGAVLKESGSVVGLTSAASVFAMASVGMAVGGGLYLTAIFGTLLVMTALAGLGWAEERFEKDRQRP